MSKVIIIRGQSGCGKSTIAKKLRDNLPGKTALIEQDYFRRHVLGERGKGGDDNVELLNLASRYALSVGYLVILEGIMHEEYYGKMLRSLLSDFPESRAFYMDVSLEETYARHSTKSNKHEFGKAEMAKWYRDKDFLGVNNESIIPEPVSKNVAVKQILNTFNQTNHK